MALINRKIFQQLLDGVVLPSRMTPEEMSKVAAPLMQYVRSHSIPRRLYKFRGANKNSIRALMKDQCYVSPPQFFNDPFDSNFLFKQDELLRILEISSPREMAIRFRNEILDEKASEPYVRQWGKVAVAEIQEKLRDADERCWDKVDSDPEFMSYITECIGSVSAMFHDYGIACFAQNLYSTLMWSHYACNHEGFALEYDLRDYKVYDDKTYSMSVCPVIYSRKQYKAEDVASSLAIRSMGVHTENPDITCYMKCALYKSSVWQYENEWRLLV